MNDQNREAAMRLVGPVLDEMSATPGIWYVLSPCGRNPIGKLEAWKSAVRMTASFLAAGLNVYSPVVHWYPVSRMGSKVGATPPDYSSFRRAVNTPMIYATVGAVLLHSGGWMFDEELEAEALIFESLGKPVLNLPLPDDFLVD